MANYIRENSRLTVKFIDSDTEEVLLEIKDRNWMNLGEIFTTHIASDILTRELKNRKKLPKNVLILAVTELTLSE